MYRLPRARTTRNPAWLDALDVYKRSFDATSAETLIEGAEAFAEMSPDDQAFHQAHLTFRQVQGLGDIHAVLSDAVNGDNDDDDDDDDGGDGDDLDGEEGRGHRGPRQRRRGRVACLPLVSAAPRRLTEPEASPPIGSPSISSSLANTTVISAPNSTCLSGSRAGSVP